MQGIQIGRLRSIYGNTQRCIRSRGTKTESWSKPWGRIGCWKWRGTIGATKLGLRIYLAKLRLLTLDYAFAHRFMNFPFLQSWSPDQIHKLTKGLSCFGVIIILNWSATYSVHTSIIPVMMPTTDILCRRHCISSERCAGQNDFRQDREMDFVLSYMAICHMPYAIHIWYMPYLSWSWFPDLLSSHGSVKQSKGSFCASKIFLFWWSTVAKTKDCPTFLGLLKNSVVWILECTQHTTSQQEAFLRRLQSASIVVLTPWSVRHLLLALYFYHL